MFIGRQSELNYLNKRYQSKSAEFVVVYGRRRVGKTETLNEFCKGKPHIFIPAVNTPTNSSLPSFQKHCWDIRRKVLLSSINFQIGTGHFPI